ncbi:MAG: amidohydrolase [Flavobacteriales bacterium]|nr:amidohydrolase [Flavobacteriales bacterium]MCB9193327.1 amidohydrolase [Flavobacteriales bacterium]
MNTSADELVRFRHALHAHPELSGKETGTARRVLDMLRTTGPDELIDGIGGTGILATFGTDIEGPQVLVRCELDALPIKETNDLPYRSTTDGVGHKCGHDGHMAMLTGVAKEFGTERPARGRVHLIYQPAEENGEGARAVLYDDRMKQRKFDLVLALHNLPGYPLGQVVLRKKAFTPSVNSMVIKLEGRTSHAAEPENGNNPSAAVAELLQACLSMAHYEADERMRVVTPVHVLIGSPDYGISAGHGEVHLTVRCWTDEELRELEKAIEAKAQAIAEEHALGHSIDYAHTFHAVMNDAAAVDLVEQAAKRTDHLVVHREMPFKWGEDFGLFTAKVKGCMFGLGAGEDMPALHNPDYDFPDALIPHGVDLFVAAARAYLKG